MSDSRLSQSERPFIRVEFHHADSDGFYRCTTETGETWQSRPTRLGWSTTGSAGGNTAIGSSEHVRDLLERTAKWEADHGR